jgi:hypothetical protein
MHTYMYEYLESRTTFADASANASPIKRFRTVFGIDAAVLPAALSVGCETGIARIAIVNRTALRENFTGDLQD